MIVCDRFTIKHYTYDQLSKEIMLTKQIKMPFESLTSDCLILRANDIKEEQAEVIVMMLNKQKSTLVGVSGMSHEGKVYFKRQADLKTFHEFTSLVVKDDLVYVGA
jgi:hypothetical protein